MSGDLQSYTEALRKSLERRQQRALDHARSLDMTLTNEINAGRFDAPDAVIGLSAFTRVLIEAGCRSSRGQLLTPGAVQRAFILLNADWQAYCTLVMERRVQNKDHRNTEFIEPNYYECDDTGKIVDCEIHTRVWNDKAGGWVESPAFKRAKGNSKKRSDRFRYIIGPANYFASFFVGDFGDWLRKRRSLFGFGLWLHPDERKKLIEHFEYEHEAKYNAFGTHHHLDLQSQSRSKRNFDAFDRWRIEQAEAEAREEKARVAAAIASFA